MLIYGVLFVYCTVKELRDNKYKVTILGKYCRVLFSNFFDNMIIFVKPLSYVVLYSQIHQSYLFLITTEAAESR